MKKQTNRKAVVLSFALAALLSVPATAQSRQGGLFGSKSDSEQSSMLNRDEDYNMTGVNLHNTWYGHGAPVGSGLLILTAIGAGYAALKKKKEN